MSVASYKVHQVFAQQRLGCFLYRGKLPLRAEVSRNLNLAPRSYKATNLFYVTLNKAIPLRMGNDDAITLTLDGVHYAFPITRKRFGGVFKEKIRCLAGQKLNPYLA